MSNELAQVTSVWNLCKIDPEKAIAVWNEMSLIDIVEELEKKNFKRQKLDPTEIQVLETIIKIAQYIFNNTSFDVIINDVSYDSLVEYYRDSTHKEIIGSINDVGRKTVYHNYPDLRGTLDKVHFITESDRGPDTRKSIEFWISSIETRLGRRLNDNDIFYIFPKFDGVSVIFECDGNGEVIRALTRGNVLTNEAVDLTDLFKDCKFINPTMTNKPFGMKTEVVMSDDQYKAFCKKYGNFSNPRSAVSSITNRAKLNPKHLKNLTIVPLRYQEESGDIIKIPFEVNKYPVFQSKITGNLDRFHDIFDKIKRSMDLDGIPTDGIVLSAVSLDLIKALGRDGHINKWEVAYKFPPAQKKTILKQIDFQIGPLGTITPVAKVEPVVLENKTISSISLGSIDRLKSLELAIGDEVIVKYSIIPYIEVDDTCKVSQNNWIVDIPTHCSCCGHELVEDPVLKCVNPNCSSRIIGKILNYVNKLDIPNISIATITLFFTKNFLASITDLYHLDRYKQQIVNLEGFGEKSYQNIIDGINSKRTVTDYDFLGSIGIPDIGRKMFKKILSIYHIDELVEICKKGEYNQLTKLPGIKTKTAKKIVDGIVLSSHLINELRKELDIIESNSSSDKDVKGYILFTKVRDKDFERYLKSQGYEIADGYSKNVDYVITDNEMSTSSKTEKALKDNKPILTLSDAKKLFQYDPKMLAV